MASDPAREAVLTHSGKRLQGSGVVIFTVKAKGVVVWIQPQGKV